MTTLKEETIRGIKAEGAFDMSKFGGYAEHKENNRNRKNYCGTACCLAGHIVAAARRLGRDLPNAKELEERYIARTETYVDPYKQIFQEKGLRDDYEAVPRAARLAWARSYGIKSANELDFYAEGPEMETRDKFGNYVGMSQVPPEAAINHLNRVATIK